MKKPVTSRIIFIILLGMFLLSSGCSDSATENISTSSATIPASSATPSSIVMTTDKTQYARSEVVKLKVTNNLDVPAWYIGYSQPDLVFWEIERAQNDSWQGLDFRLLITEEGREVCRIILYERPIGAVTELKPHSDLLYEWDQKICPLKTVPEPFEPEMIERGKYRFAFCYRLVTVESEDIENEPWKRPIEPGETKIVYSNEFVLE